MKETLLTITQALQLVALVPTLFIAVFIVLALRDPRQSLVPVLYFLALACSFVLPLLEPFPSLQTNKILRVILLFGESLSPAFCYLLVVQFITSRLPPLPHWLVLTLPVLGGSSLVYAEVSMVGEELCMYGRWCLDPRAAKVLYSLFSTTLIFLLLMMTFSRTTPAITGEVHRRLHKYWLVVSLILLNLMLLTIDLSLVAGLVDEEGALFANTMIRLTFVYVVMTSVFRVFDREFSLALERLPTARRLLSESYILHAEHIRSMMETDHVYREMGLGRDRLAAELGVNSHHVSRIINRHFGKSVTGFINDFRVNEAKKRLLSEPATAITVIAFEVGFNSIASFNRVFKDTTGYSPTAFRDRAVQIGSGS